MRLTMSLNGMVNSSIEERILAAAEEEFYQAGFAGSSTAKIAKSVGVTHAMVNYYYRTKEQLFLRILDGHIEKAVSVLKGVMREQEDIASVLKDAASALFGLFNECRHFPFLLLDASRSHPEYLARYRETLLIPARQILTDHAERLKGKLSDSNVTGLFDTVLSMSYAPFLHIPFLQNVAGYDKDQITDYLYRRKVETLTLLEKRFSNTL